MVVMSRSATCIAFSVPKRQELNRVFRSSPDHGSGDSRSQPKFNGTATRFLLALSGPWSSAPWLMPVGGRAARVVTVGRPVLRFVSLLAALAVVQPHTTGHKPDLGCVRTDLRKGACWLALEKRQTEPD